MEPQLDLENFSGSGSTPLHFRLMINLEHMLNMELDFHSLFELHVHSWTHWLRPPAFGLIYEGAIDHPR